MAKTDTFNGIPIIDDSTDPDFLFGFQNGEEMGRGLVPRSMESQPPGYLEDVPQMKAVVGIDILSDDQINELVEQQERDKSSLQHIRDRGNGGKPIPSTNQGQDGYCWSFGTTNALMLLRAKMNLPYVPLCGTGPATVIMNAANQGAWGAKSLEWMMKYGCPSTSVWPERARDLRYATQAMYQDAAKRKVDGAWVDLESPVYDRDLTIQQVDSLLAQNIPVVGDFNWWGHCVVMLRTFKIENGSRGRLIWNSWADSWGDRGMAILRGNKAIPDNAVAPYRVFASFAKVDEEVNQISLT